MSVKVAKSRFITSSFAGFYQQTLSNFATTQELGSCLIRQAEVAQILRKAEKLEEVSTVLCNFPISEIRTIGNYYKGLGAYRRGEDARRIFEEVVEYSRTYKAKAFMSLAAVEARAGKYERELGYFTQAIKYANDPSTFVEISRSIAVVKAKEGFRREALKDIESLFPLVKYAAPSIYYQYLNSFAVELIEAGRIEEASNISQIVLASPFVFAYPEWRETWQDLALPGYKSRSVVLVPELPLKVKDNVVPMPVNNNPSLPQQECAKVLDLQAWIEKMVKEQNDEPNDENIDEMDRKDLLVKLLELTTVEDIDEEKLRKVVKYTLEVMTKK